MTVDQSGAIFAEGTDKTVRRRAVVQNAEGFEVVVGESTFTTRMVIWPATGKERQQLPEGERGKNAVGFVATDRLFGVRAPGSGFKPDRFDHDGTQFEIMLTQAWGELGNFWGGTAIEVGQ